MGLTSRNGRATTFLKDSSQKTASRQPPEVASENFDLTLSPKNPKRMIVDEHSSCFLNLPVQKIRKVAVCSNRQRLEKGLLPSLFHITSSSGHGNCLTRLSKKQRMDTSGQIRHSFSQTSGIHTAQITWEIEK